MYSVNARSVTNKVVSLTKAMQDREVDIAVIHKLNTVKLTELTKTRLTTDWLKLGKVILSFLSNLYF